MNNNGIMLKICGITSIIDRDMVIAGGADFFGSIIGVSDSLRSIGLAEAQIIFNTRDIEKVAVLVNPTRDFVHKVIDKLTPAAIQLHGKETPEFVSSLKETVKCSIWKAVHIPLEFKDRRDLIENVNSTFQAFAGAGVSVLLLDTMVKTKNGDKTGGSGISFDWHVIREIVVPQGVNLFIAGGINPDNVYRLLSSPSIKGLDVNSGVEQYPGKKDPVKLRKFFEAMKKRHNNQSAPKN